LDLPPAALGVFTHVDGPAGGDAEAGRIVPVGGEFGAVELVQLGWRVSIREEVAPVAGGSLGCCMAAATHPDGRMGALQRWGSDHHVLEPEAVPAVGEPPGTPRGLEDLDGFVGASAALGAAQAQQRVPSARYPGAIPSSSRPPDSTSTMAASSASRSGCCNGASSTAVPSRMREVRIANAASIGNSAGR
jgi:hypothetical protein